MSSSLSITLPLKSFQANGRKGDVFWGKQQTGGRPRAMAIAAQGRDSFDHLQRAATNRQQQQPQPKKRVVPLAPVGLWDRFPSARTVQQMMETMERIMEDPYGYPSSVADENAAGYKRGGRTPWEIKEGENEYQMRFDMPGMTKKDVKVSVEEKMLVIKAEKQSEKSPESEEQEEDVAWSAKSYGRYSSRIGLPENVAVEKIKAEVRDGVLYVTIPKAKIASKVVDINVQ